MVRPGGDPGPVRGHRLGDAAADLRWGVHHGAAVRRGASPAAVRVALGLSVHHRAAGRRAVGHLKVDLQEVCLQVGVHRQFRRQPVVGRVRLLRLPASVAEARVRGADGAVGRFRGQLLSRIRGGDSYRPRRPTL